MRNKNKKKFGIKLRTVTYTNRTVNITDQYLGCARFESQWGHQQSSLTSSVIFLNSYRQIPGVYLDKATTAYFQIPSDSSLVYQLTITVEDRILAADRALKHSTNNDNTIKTPTATKTNSTTSRTLRITVDLNCVISPTGKGSSENRQSILKCI